MDARSNFEQKMIDDICDSVEIAGKRVAESITPIVAGSTDAAGGHVESLTEAVMGMTSALMSIAGAIHDLSDSVSHIGRE